MSNETYLNHPNFGLLYQICVLNENQELYTTLYAQRLFFSVMIKPTGIVFEIISRSDARLMLENRIRQLRRAGQSKEYNELQAIHQKTFQ